MKEVILSERRAQNVIDKIRINVHMIDNLTRCDLLIIYKMIQKFRGVKLHL